MRKLFLIPFTFGLAVVASWLWYNTLTAAALPSTPVPTYNLTELAAEQAPTLTQLTIGEKSTLPEQRMGQLPLPSHGRAPHTTTPADLSAYVVNSRDLPDCFNFTATAVITIAPNTPVNTCYFIANTSADLPLTTHTLTTTLDGFLLDEYPYALMPNQMLYLLRAHTVPTTTVVQARWTTQDEGGNVYTDVATTTIIVDPNFPVQPEAVIYPTNTVGGHYQYPNTIITRYLTINNYGTGMLEWSQTECAQPTAAWFSLSPASGAVSPNGPVNIGAIFNTVGMSTTGIYTTSFCLATNDPIQPVVQRTAVMRILGEPTGGIDFELTLSLESFVCGETDQITTTTNMPVTLCYTLFNGTDTILTEHFVQDPRLGNVTLQAMVLPGQSVQYVADFFFFQTETVTTTWSSSNGQGALFSDTDTAVITTEDVGPIAQISPLALQSTQITNTVRAQLLIVENLGTGSLDWSLDGCSGTWPTWLSAVPDTGSVIWPAYQGVELLFDSTGLAVGQYTADICFTSNDGLSNTPITIPVTLNVINSLTDLFTFQKGVTTDLNDCSTAETLPNLPPTITVTAGSLVHYCYVLTNITSAEVLERHDVLDDVYGVLAENLHFSLYPEEFIVFYLTAQISETVTSTTSWTGYTPEGLFQTSLGTTTVFVADDTPPTPTPEPTGTPEPSPTPSVTPTPTTGTAAIALAVTVGLDPTTCATADELFLDTIPTAGQSVTYCYTITNMGTMPLAWHNVEDTAEGMLMQGVQTPLGVGQSYTLLRTTTLTHAQAVTTTWHAYNEARAGSPSATAADTIHIHTTAASHTLYLPLVTR